MSESTRGTGGWSMQGEMGAPAPTAVWGCRSLFCLQRGPFWTRGVKQAQTDAGKHRERRFLGLFGHDAVVGPRRGQTVIQFLREMGLTAAAAKVKP
jgi:hypothetical protein